MARLIVLLAVALALSTAEEKYQYALDELWEQADTDGDGELSHAEYDVALVKLAIQDEPPFNDHSTFDDIDTDRDHGISQQEIVDYYNSNPGRAQPFIDAMSGRPADDHVRTGNIERSVFGEVFDAKATAEMTMLAGGSISEIFPGDRLAMVEAVAVLLSISTTAVVATFLPTSAAGGRRLSTEAAGVTITFKAFVADSDAAAAAQATLQAQCGSAADASAFFGGRVTVVEDPAFATADTEVGNDNLFVSIIGVAVLVLLMVGLCVWGSCLAKKKVGKAKRADASFQPVHGCCDSCPCCLDGCCSFYALFAWAGSLSAGGVFLAAGALLLYLKVSELKGHVMDILDTMLTLKKGDGVAAQALEAVDVNLIETIGTYVDLLDLVVLVPGGVTLLLLLGAAACAARPRAKSYCCAKCFVCLGDLLIVLTMAVYGVFAAIGVAATLPIVREMVATLHAMCDVIVPALQQALADVTEMLANAEASGLVDAADMEEIRGDLDAAETEVSGFDKICNSFKAIDSTLTTLFGVALLAVCALAHVWVVNNGLCCAAKCCSNPAAVAAAAAAKKSAAGAEMVPRPLKNQPLAAQDAEKGEAVAVVQQV